MCITYIIVVLPTINISTTDYTVEFGTPVTITCTVNAEPGVIEIYWQKEDPNGDKVAGLNYFYLEQYEKPIYYSHSQHNSSEP
jgi:hypothetical protein